MPQFLVRKGEAIELHEMPDVDTAVVALQERFDALERGQKSHEAALEALRASQEAMLDALGTHLDSVIDQMQAALTALKDAFSLISRNEQEMIGRMTATIEEVRRLRKAMPAAPTSPPQYALVDVDSSVILPTPFGPDLQSQVTELIVLVDDLNMRTEHIEDTLAGDNKRIIIIGKK
jgi:hypothetical protein